METVNQLKEQYEAFLKENDKFVARVIAQRFELNDKYISIVAELAPQRDLNKEQKPILVL